LLYSRNTVLLESNYPPVKKVKIINKKKKMNEIIFNSKKKKGKTVKFKARFITREHKPQREPLLFSE